MNEGINLDTCEEEGEEKEEEEEEEEEEKGSLLLLLLIPTPLTKEIRIESSLDRVLKGIRKSQFPHHGSENVGFF